MDLRIDHFHHFVTNPVDLSPVLTKLDAILTLLSQQGVAMSAELDALTVKVQETTTIEQSAIELLNGLSVQIASLKTDPAALQALADQLSSKSAELAAAIQANSVPS